MGERNAAVHRGFATSAGYCSLVRQMFADLFMWRSTERIRGSWNLPLQINLG